MKRSKPFQFKEFTVEQTLATFKVTSDSVYLGAWANIEDAKHILDIGTGTSILALMCAQRNKNAQITAIEPDLDSYTDACTNIQNSAWKNRISIFQSKLEAFQSDIKFDHIISNPPYFENQLENENKRLSAARHAADGFLDLLFEKSYVISSSDAKMSIIIPESTFPSLNIGKWHLSRKFRLNTGGKNVRYILALEFSKNAPEHIDEDTLFIRKGGEYSKEYLNQTKAFYLFANDNP